MFDLILRLFVALLIALVIAGVITTVEFAFTSSWNTGLMKGSFGVVGSILGLLAIIASARAHFSRPWG